jgi:ribosomal-protein-alanine N-acetyltransferase
MGTPLREPGMNGNILIRSMTLEDLDGVMAVELDSFQTPWSLSSFAEELEQNRLARYLVAEENGEIVGYVGAWLVINEAQVTNVAVSSHRRGQGIGRMLMNQLMDLARNNGMESMTLEVRVLNTVARHLYQELGFVETGIRKNYYSETKEDALILWREKL